MSGKDQNYWLRVTLAVIAWLTLFVAWLSLLAAPRVHGAPLPFANWRAGEYEYRFKNPSGETIVLRFVLNADGTARSWYDHAPESGFNNLAWRVSGRRLILYSDHGVYGLGRFRFDPEEKVRRVR